MDRLLGGMSGFCLLILTSSYQDHHSRSRPIFFILQSVLQKGFLAYEIDGTKLSFFPIKFCNSLALAQVATVLFIEVVHQAIIMHTGIG